MESMISIDTIGWLVALLAFTLLLASASTRRAARRAPQRLHGPQQCRAHDRAHDRGSEATVSGRARKGSPPAHGKESTPC
jgi:hypothetical protein